MNQHPSDMYYQPQHMSAGPPPQPQTVTSNYPHPSLIQPGPPYAHQQSYAYYQNGLTSPQTAPPTVASMSAPNVLPLPGVGNQQVSTQYSGFDTSGQIAPPGMKPRVTATLWEDEGSLCFQVEARGICVARREDNHMINGTKLLNVAGMTRGRRDGILKSEKVRHVVKIGPMHLKGVWIPFDRALDFANKEKITELLYPLFVHNIGALLYHPTNQNRTNQVMAAAERRKQETGQMRSGPPSGASPPGGLLPSIQQQQHHPQHPQHPQHAQHAQHAHHPQQQHQSQQHHHHMPLPGPPQLPSHNSSGRPFLDRAHTLPTPPTTSSSVMTGMGGAEYASWNHQQGLHGPQSTNPISIDTSLSNSARSMPATPATTPPGNSLQSMQSYPQVTQPYDNSRGGYTHAGPQPSYSSNNSPQDRNVYGQTSSYTMKNEMGPPSGRPVATGVSEGSDVKPPNGMMQQGEQHAQGGDDEADHEAEYTHDSGTYDAGRSAYSYNAPPIAPDHQQMSDMAGSPGQQAHSGRATPRTAPPPQPYYQQTGYSTPPRAPTSSSSLYNVMSNDRGPGNNTSASDVYGTQPDMNSAVQNGYGPPPAHNGMSASLKRSRDDDDEPQQRSSLGQLDSKRRKTLVEGAVPPSGYDMSRPTPSSLSSRRR